MAIVSFQFAILLFEILLSYDVTFLLMFCYKIFPQSSTYKDSVQFLIPDIVYT